MIRIDRINKRYRDVQAVKDISFAAQDGRITALLGPNGAGKSTTLRMLAGVVEPDSGSAEVAGIDCATDPMGVRMAIGVLPHQAGLYDRLTGLENIRYFGRLQGLTPDELDRNVEGLIGELDMAEFCERRCAGFSQGQKIKIALARALVHNPQHVILDEPTNGLDVMATRALRRIVRRLREQGKCILFSSHIMQEVEALCDDVVVISRGEVRYDGTLEGFRAQAQTDDLEEAFIALTGMTENDA